jgi:ATP-dependent Lon protease
MSKKNVLIGHLDKNTIDIFKNKLVFFQDLIQNTLIQVERNKLLDIIGISYINSCVDSLKLLSNKIAHINQLLLKNNNKDIILGELQTLNNEFALLIKTHGTLHLEDLLKVCLGENKITMSLPHDVSKLLILKKYFHPLGYSVLNNNTVDLKPLVCYDIDMNTEEFHVKIHGMQIHVYSNILNKTLCIHGIIDNVLVDILNDDYTTARQLELVECLKCQPNNNNNVITNFVGSLMLKDYLITHTATDLKNRLIGYENKYTLIQKTHMGVTVKDFIKDNLYNKYYTLLVLLVHSHIRENMYFAYLLYDLISNDSNGSVDTNEQIILFDNFPWGIKKHFNEAMKKTVQYTTELSKGDLNKIPIEQQICLLNVSDIVKEKAMMKLKEVKAKNEDSGTKARQYLDGLLKIPFTILRQEPILNQMNHIRHDIQYIYNLHKLPALHSKQALNTVEIYQCLEYFKSLNNSSIDPNYDKLKQVLIYGNKLLLIKNISIINNILVKHHAAKMYVTYKTSDNKTTLVNKIVDIFAHFLIETNKTMLDELMLCFQSMVSTNNNSNQLITISNNIKLVEDKLHTICKYMTEVRQILDTVVHGHTNAKKQLERIIGQWINGNGQESHVIGFEGNPGVGKTTLAKGLANCLKDEHGNSRPFSLIAIGGDSNASSLIGHSYTYVGSTWGQIVQILMDSKCMNPIILIDEIDKVSKTEHGKEIIGVLTHLLDPSQNKSFQDKYFSGIDLDISRVLFVLSYNDPHSIDKILLDRVNRIKFESLSVEDKIIISNKHLLPELYTKIGLDGAIHFSDAVLKFIIEEYTLEPGVRKLKEKLFEIVGEINLNILNGKLNNTTLPIQITIDDVKHTYFKESREVKIQKIHTKSEVGVINALWANDLLQGGVLPLQVSFIPSNKFLDLTLTGSLGDVMRESISVSLTNAWNLTSYEKQQEIMVKYNNPSTNNVFGLHIHCPDISTKKDGPSATTAFTVIIYSLFNNIKIKNNFGITGETSFNYCLTEIGGLREKIIHSIPAGVTEFIYPVENQRDFVKIMEKYKDYDIIKGIKFHPVNTIREVFDLILEK